MECDVSLPQADGNDCAAGIGVDEFAFPVTMVIASDAGYGFASDGKVSSRAQVALAVAEQNRHGVRTLVGDNDITIAVVVEVVGGDIDGTGDGSERERLGWLEGRVAISQQHENLVEVGLRGGDNQVLLAVVVQVIDGDAGGAGDSHADRGLPKCAVGVADQDGDRVASVGRNCEIGVAIAVEISAGQAFPGLPHGEIGGCLKGSGAGAQHNGNFA